MPATALDAECSFRGPIIGRSHPQLTGAAQLIFGEVAENHAFSLEALLGVAVDELIRHAHRKTVVTAFDIEAQQVIEKSTRIRSPKPADVAKLVFDLCGEPVADWNRCFQPLGEWLGKKGRALEIV